MERGHFKKLTNVGSFLMRLLPKRFVLFVYDLFSSGRGYICMGIRVICIKRLAAECGDNVAVFNNVTLKHIDRMHIGNNVSIHTQCYLDALGEIYIGDNVSIAHSSSVVSFDHTYQDNNLPIKYNTVKKGKIVIEDDVWIGCGCRILQGVTIGQRCVVAAGSVVTKSVLPHSLCGGVPAKIIKQI